MEIAKEYERIAMMFRMRFSKGLIRRDPMVVDVLMILVFSLLMLVSTIDSVKIGIFLQNRWNCLSDSHIILTDSELVFWQKDR